MDLNMGIDQAQTFEELKYDEIVAHRLPIGTVKVHYSSKKLLY